MRRGTTHSGDLFGRGTTRADDAPGTPTQSRISPSILVCEGQTCKDRTEGFQASRVRKGQEFAEQATANRAYVNHWSIAQEKLSVIFNWARAFSGCLGEGRDLVLCSVLSRKVDVRLPGKENSNSHCARPVHLIITMIKWIRTSRLSITSDWRPASTRWTHRSPEKWGGRGSLPRFRPWSHFPLWEATRQKRRKSGGKSPTAHTT